MDYLLQCLRLNGGMGGIAPFEDLMLTDVWQSSPRQVLFYNFRISELQKDRLLELQSDYIIRFNREPLSGNEDYSVFAMAMENNLIIDIREIATWEDMIIKEARPVEVDNG